MASLVGRVLSATAVLRVPDTVARIARPSERMHALLRAEMDRRSGANAGARQVSERSPHPPVWLGA